MAEWKRTSLISVIELIGGGTPKTSAAEYWNGTINWLSVKDFNNDSRYVYETEKTITEAGLNNSSTKLLKKDDIIVSARGTVGELAMIPFPMAFNQSCYGIRGKGNINNVFLYYLIKNSITKLKSLTHGSVFDTITRDTFANVEVFIPTIETQNKIANILSNLDDKIELNNKVNNNLEEQAQALFRSWFVDFEPFGMVMPRDWKGYIFSSFLSPRVEKSNNLDIPIFSVTDNGIFPRNDKFKKTLSKSTTKNKLVYQTDLVFGMSREILNWGIMRQPIGSVSSAYNVFSVNSKINSNYLESYIKSNIHYFKDLIKPASREGQGIDKNALMQKEIFIPTSSILKSYYNIEDALTKTAYWATEENKKLVDLRDTLLPKLMSGELDVSDIDL